MLNRLMVNRLRWSILGEIQKFGGCPVSRNLLNYKLSNRKNIACPWLLSPMVKKVLRLTRMDTVLSIRESIAPILSASPDGPQAAAF